MGLDRVMLRLVGLVLVLIAVSIACMPALQRLTAPAFSATGAAVPDHPIVRIMPLGDSITRGIGQADAAGRYTGFRGPLQEQLEAGAVPCGFKYDFVGSVHDPGVRDGDGEGHGGWTIAQLSAHVDGWLRRYRPDVVLLHAGTNDVTEDTSVSQLTADLAHLVNQIRTDRPDAQLFVARIIGTQGVSAREQARNREFAAAIPAVVAAAGPRVHLVDQSGVTGDDLYDHHHPNAWGYAKMAFTWYEAMRAVIGPQWQPAGDPRSDGHAVLCRFDYVSRAETCHQRKVSAPAP